MNLNLVYEEANVQLLKTELGIASSKPHCVELNLWRYAHAPDLKLECRVTLFTDDDRCVQGSGATFNAALEEIRLKLKPKARAATINPGDELTASSS